MHGFLDETLDHWPFNLYYCSQAAVKHINTARDAIHVSVGITAEELISTMKQTTRTPRSMLRYRLWQLTAGSWTTTWLLTQVTSRQTLAPPASQMSSKVHARCYSWWWLCACGGGRVGLNGAWRVHTLCLTSHFTEGWRPSANWIQLYLTSV